MECVLAHHLVHVATAIVAFTNWEREKREMQMNDWMILLIMIVYNVNIYSANRHDRRGILPLK
jgi:hypothetical protein